MAQREPYTPGSLDLKKRAELVHQNAAPVLVDHAEQILAGKSEEDRQDAKDTAAGILTSTQAELARTPEEQRQTLVEERKRLIGERAQIQGRGLSSGERIALAILSAAPLVASAANPNTSNPYAAAQGSNQIHKGMIDANMAQNDLDTAQKDVELKYNEGDIDRSEKIADREATFDQQDKLDQRKGAREEARGVRLQDRQFKLDQKKADTQERKDLISLQKDAGNSNRSRTGALKKYIDGADQGLQMINGYALDHFKKPLTQLSDAELVEVLNGLAPHERSELAAKMDNLVTNGSSTISGREHMEVKTAQGEVQKFAQYLTGKTIPSNAGPVLKRQLSTILRERELGAIKYAEEQKGLKASYGHLLRSGNPQTVKDAETLLRDPLTVDEILNGGRPQQATPAASAPQGRTPEQEARYQELLKKSKK